MRINLTVKAGPHQGEVFEYKERANFIVGRSERAHVRLPCRIRVSRVSTNAITGCPGLGRVLYAHRCGPHAEHKKVLTARPTMSLSQIPASPLSGKSLPFS